jgi:HD-GYP domain-containing protein (c-di-GMP phosphodiesterase class II)
MAPAAALQELRAGAGSQFWPAGVAALLEVLAAEEREQPPSAA